MRKLIPFLSCVCLLASLAFGQQEGDNAKQGSDNETQSAIWTGNFAGGQVMIPVSKIAAIAQQKYLLDGQFMIYEVTIDVVGNTVTRIYYIEPLAEAAAQGTNLGSNILGRSKDASNLAQARTNTGHIDPQTIVTKTYPLTTHSHTIEYRVASLDEVNGVYKSLATAFQRGRGRTYTAARK